MVVERPNGEKQMYKWKRRIGLSTLFNPFHTEHDPPDVISLDNNTAMQLADSNTITDDVTRTLLYVSFEIFLPCTNQRLLRATSWYELMAALM